MVKQFSLFFASFFVFATLAFGVPSSVFSQQQTQITQEEIEQARREFMNSPEFLELKKNEEKEKAIQEQIDAFFESRLKLLSPGKNIREQAAEKYLDVQIYPEYPGPEEKTTISVESYLVDLARANMQWSVNGKIAKKGIGQKSFSFTTGPAGSVTTVSLSVAASTGEKISRSFSFKPLGVSVLWEADTYTPPFYKGKALASPESRVRIVAIPDSATAKNPLGGENLVYVWKKNGENISEVSGYGKNTFRFTAPGPFDRTRIGFEVSSVDNTAKSEKNIFLPLVNPLVLFYEKTPLEGVVHRRAIMESLSVPFKEISLSAEPYFFSNESEGKARASQEWSLNGATVNNYGKTITLRNDKGSSGSSVVTFSARSPERIFQSAKNSVTLRFEPDKVPGPQF